MRIGRSVPPAAAPLEVRDLFHGIAGAFAPRRALRARQAELHREFNVTHVFPVSSGTAALTLTLKALKSVSSATEVVIPAYTCFSVPAAVLKAGLRPVPCDINPSTFDFDASLLQQRLGPSTLCVIAHHLFGIPSDIERLRAMCGARGIFVVEDAAQAMGVEHNSRKLGTMGDVGIFSFGRGKNVTCGSGGVVMTGSATIGVAIAAEYRDVPAPGIVETIKDFMALALLAVFIRPALYWIPAALPCLRLGETVFPREIHIRRLSGMKAGSLRNWQTKLARSNNLRSQTADYLRARIPSSHGTAYPYLRLPVIVESPHEKQRLYSLSRAKGLGMSAGYPSAVNEIPELRAVVDGQQFPSARFVAATLVTLPTHQWLRADDKAALVALCKDVCFAC
jgi:dTDP-4-amino-4,6-dideoxygalactose transaminase